MKTGKSKLLRVVLTHALAMALFLLAGAAVYAVPTAFNLTIHWSSPDGVDLVAPVVIEVEKGTTISEAISKILGHSGGFFSKAGYYEVKNLTTKPITEFAGWDDYRSVDYNSPITEDTDLYDVMFKEIDTVELTLDPPVCGTETDESWESIATNPPKFTIPDGAHFFIYSYNEDGTGRPAAFWDLDADRSAPFAGKFQGGETYYCNTHIGAEFGYYFPPDVKAKVNNAKIENQSYGFSGGEIIVSVTAVHDWDEGTIKKPATTTTEGEKVCTCKACGKTGTFTIPKLPDPTKEMGTDGTAYGPGASAEAAEAAILALKDDKDPKGTVFGGLQLKAAKTKKSSIKLTWKKVAGAKKYIIYSNACGKGKKYQKLAEVAGTSKTIKKVAGKKLVKGKYYKFLMVAVDANGKVVTTSKTVHAATAGGKVGNPTKVTTKAKKNKVTVKAKKTFKLAAKQAGKKIKKHRAVSYESSNTKVATVSKKGVIKGVKKGKCKIYAYAQNGVCAVINVTVK